MTKQTEKGLTMCILTGILLWNLYCTIKVAMKLKKAVK